MSGRRGGRRRWAQGRWPRVGAALAGILVLGGCADLAGAAGADPHPCDQGAPVLETLDVPQTVVESEVADWQQDAGLLAEELTTLAGDRLAGVWIDWTPEPSLVVNLTEGPEVAAVHKAATASGLLVDVRYTGPVSREALLAAAERISAEAGQVPAVSGWGVDELNSRLTFDVASGEDGGAAACTQLAELLVDAGVPYAFTVFDGPAESTLRTTVAITDAWSSGGTELELIVGSCNGVPEVTALVESADEVRIEVTSTVPAPGWGGNDCLDALAVTLGEPLDGRPVVDLTSGAQIRVQVPPS